MESDVRVARHRIDDETREMLGKEIDDRVDGIGLDPDRDALILGRIGAWALRRHLPVPALAALAEFTGTGDHALLLENLPRQRFPATPLSGFGEEAALAVTNAVHLGLVQVLGLTPYAVDYENSGRLMRNVVPNPAAAGTTSSWGADSEFFWHTDNPHLPFGDPGGDPRPFIPRYLTFYAVRNTERVPTELMAAEAATSRLGTEVRQQLTAASYQVAAPDSNDAADDGGRRVLGAAAVVERWSDGHRVRFDRGTTRGLTADADAALRDWIAALADAPCWQPVLEPGQFLIFDNYRVLHRRRAFAPAATTHPRWLRRCYAS